MTEGFDVGLEMSGNAAAFRDMLRDDEPRRQRRACSASRPSEVAIDWNQVIFKGLVIKGIYGREMFETWYKMAAMLQSGLDITPGDHAPLRASTTSSEAFETMGSGQSGKVILDWAA